MAEYGVTREDFGRIAVAQRTNALAYPNAIMKSPLTLEQYLSAGRFRNRSGCSIA
jgi:acetyl-CoA acetyltransferase